MDSVRSQDPFSILRLCEGANFKPTTIGRKFVIYGGFDFCFSFVDTLIAVCIRHPFPPFSSFCTAKFGERARTESGERFISPKVPRTQVLPFFLQFSSSVFASSIFSLVSLIFEGSKETTLTLDSLLLCIDFAHMNIQRIVAFALCITASSHRVNCFVESRSFL